MKDEPRSPVSLLEVEHEDGVAAVCRDADDGSLWLTAELGSDEWWDLDGYEIADEDSDTHLQGTPAPCTHVLDAPADLVAAPDRREPVSKTVDLWVLISTC